MTFTRIGGLAALTCAGTYLFGFALLVTLLAPLGYGTAGIDPDAVTAFIDARPGVMIVWNTVIYVVNALALSVLVVVFAAQLVSLPSWAAVTQAIGLIWAALVLGAGMIANVAVEQAAHIYPTDPQAAADLWFMLHHVELGLGGGNEIAGGVWIACVSVATGIAGRLPRIVNALGLLTGLGGLLTVVPALGETAGSVFGLGAIVWFLAVGAILLLARAEPVPEGS
ncbi:MAG: hypothetical protein GC146_16800 [Limimaricola sp.]|uniref:hypothetical protein n=1 Tax=Limimaricola sp. TaxID=2211665 RepID=UPI001D21A039|nr:hypothetical protein [Limimaricola sp.]MBI1418878.1 hypothetical protein [Limimaricola sp.]